MQSLVYVPDWLGAALVGAAIAAIGFVAKLITEAFLEFHKERRSRRAFLVELQSLLRASLASFRIQQKHTQNLLAIISNSHPKLIANAEGYEETISNAYGEFTSEELVLHSIIRGITTHAMRPTNSALIDWLKRDAYFKAQKPSPSALGKLAKYLALLETHLILWHAKYEIWIPDHKEHALVYLWDEKEHGIGFPTGIDDLVQDLLS